MMHTYVVVAKTNQTKKYKKLRLTLKTELLVVLYAGPAFFS